MLFEFFFLSYFIYPFFLFSEQHRFALYKPEKQVSYVDVLAAKIAH